jgi:hypothetical protein
MGDFFNKPIADQLAYIIAATYVVYLLVRFMRAVDWRLGWKAISDSPPVNSEPEYIAAYEFKNAFQPANGVDYTWVGNYADFNYRQLHATNETLDKKAEFLISLFTGGTGLLTVGAAVNLPVIPTSLRVAWALVLLFAILAIVVAGFIRLPRLVFLPPSVAWATQYVGAYDKDSHARFLAQWHLACEGIRLSNGRKARGLYIATACGIIAIVILGLSFFIAICTIEYTGSKSPNPGVLTMPEGQPPQASAPSPDSQPQTPPISAVASPAAQAGPQFVQNTYVGDPASQAGPQSLLESDGNK